MKNDQKYIFPIYLCFQSKTLLVSSPELNYGPCCSKPRNVISITEHINDV